MVTNIHSSPPRHARLVAFLTDSRTQKLVTAGGAVVNVLALTIAIYLLSLSGPADSAVVRADGPARLSYFSSPHRSLAAPDSDASSVDPPGKKAQPRKRRGRPASGGFE